MKEYYIRNVHCAAYCILAGCTLSRVEGLRHSNKRYLFEDSENLQNCIALFKSGEYFSPEFAEVVAELSDR